MTRAAPAAIAALCALALLAPPADAARWRDYGWTRDDWYRVVFRPRQAYWSFRLTHYRIEPSDSCQPGVTILSRGHRPKVVVLPRIERTRRIVRTVSYHIGPVPPNRRWVVEVFATGCRSRLHVRSA